jgi:uncharacterized protein YjbJ (UPF0337 family)
METNKRIEGIGHQVKGAVMESLGIAIGDAKLAADGRAERAVGDKLNPEAEGDQLAGIDADRIMGIGRQIKGVLVEHIGKLADSQERRAEGVKERNAGVEQNIAGGERDVAREAKSR